MNSSPNVVGVIKSWRMMRVGHTIHMGEVRNAYKILAGKPEGKKPLGKPRHKLDFRERGWKLLAST
jgi:hypothetical protein